MIEKILIVDDDINLLSSMNQQLHNKLQISTSEGGKTALALVKSEGPFAIVISDMNMPGMNGVEFLSSLKKLSPDTVRMMLTESINPQTAVEAINEGSIFWFFTKPCPTDILVKGIEAGLEQYRLVTAEKELLKNTLAGSVKVLTDMLSTVNSETLGRSTYLWDWARKMGEHLDLSQFWVLDLAVMLSKIGWVTIPEEIQKKVNSEESLSPIEEELIQKIPETGRKRISHIPRLEAVAEIVYYQNKGFDGSGFPDD